MSSCSPAVLLLLVAAACLTKAPCVYPVQLVAALLQAKERGDPQGWLAFQVMHHCCPSCRLLPSLQHAQPSCPGTALLLTELNSDALGR